MNNGFIKGDNLMPSTMNQKYSTRITNQNFRTEKNQIEVLEASEMKKKDDLEKPMHCTNRTLSH